MIGAPIHRIIRNPNYASSIYNRIANRASPFENTLTILSDPQKKRQLYLIGTTNTSTLLAKRTRDLIKQIKPDSVFVQTNEKWWKLVSKLNNVESQKDLYALSNYLKSSNEWEIENNPRGLIFKFRFYPWLAAMSWLFRLPSDFAPFNPGLEMKYAIEEGIKSNSTILFGGNEIDPETLHALKLEKRMDLLPLFYRSFWALHNKRWRTEYLDNYRMLNTLSGEAFAEIIDKYRMSWFIKLFEKYAPHQKKIFIDQKDVDLFHNIYRAPGQKIVAVVNQWHTLGIESHWRHTTGTEVKAEPINPIGDMDIEKFMEANLVNDKLREIVSTINNSEPATWNSYITQYHKESQEPHRNRHVYFLSHDDPDLHHGSFKHHDSHGFHFHPETKQFDILPFNTAAAGENKAGPEKALNPDETPKKVEHH